MKFFALTLFFLFFVTDFSFAQQNVTDTPHIDILYLKDGSILRGKILEYRPNENIKMQILGDSLTLTIPQNVVKKLVQEIKKEKKLITNTPKIYEFRERGWYGFLGLQALPYRHSVSYNRVSNNFGYGLNGAFGYRFHRIFGVAVGGGVEQLYNKSLHVLYHTNIEMRGHFLKSYNSPFYSLAVGYAKPQSDQQAGILKTDGGLYFYPALGYRLGANSGTNFTIDVGFRFQNAGYTFPIPIWQQTRDETTFSENWTYRRIAIRLGLLF